MPTSSIFHNFIISDPDDVNRFISAIEKGKTSRRKAPGKLITDRNEITALMAKRKERKNKMIYLDAAATTKPHDEVAKVVYETMLNTYGNASSIHSAGREARDIIDKVRAQIAQDINCIPEEIVFTSGASESNALALNRPDAILVRSQLEHKSILMNETPLVNFRVYNDSCGNINLDHLDDSLLLYRKNFTDVDILVSIQGANSEIGTIQDIKAISGIVHKYDGIYHCDATQLYPYQRIDVQEMGIDMMSVSAHKFGGPKGVGFLYIRKGIPKPQPLIYGTQENRLRGGTYNTPLIAGMGRALELLNRDYGGCRTERAALWGTLKSRGFKLNGPALDSNRLPNNLSVWHPDIEAKDFITIADMNSIMVSAGSACSSGLSEPSETLVAIGRTKEEAESTVRITLEQNTFYDWHRVKTLLDFIL